MASAEHIVQRTDTRITPISPPLPTSNFTADAFLMLYYNHRLHLSPLSGRPQKDFPQLHARPIFRAK